MELPTKTVRFINDEPVSLAAYWRKLRGHDWYYNFSDDGGAWRAGTAAQKVLEAIAKQSPAHHDLYKGWVTHMFSGPGWANEVKAPRPEEPKED